MKIVILWILWKVRKNKLKGRCLFVTLPKDLKLLWNLFLLKGIKKLLRKKDNVFFANYVKVLQKKKQKDEKNNFIVGFFEWISI